MGSPDLRNPDAIHADLYRKINQMAWIHSTLHFLTGMLLLLVLLVGCTPERDNSPTPSSTSAPGANAVTRRTCDATVSAYLGDRIATAETKAELLGLANTAGVDGKVRSAIVDGLYAGNGMPIGDQITNRYNLVLSACRRSGWAG